MKFQLFILFLVFSMTSCIENAKETGQSPAGFNKIETPTRQLRHIVLFKFKETAAADSIKQVEAAFAALPSKISEIKHFEWGTNNSPEGLDKGFTHSFMVTFGSEADREAYLPHPDHLAFVEVLKPHLDDVLVIDYWTE